MKIKNFTLSQQSKLQCFSKRDTSSKAHLKEREILREGRGVKDSQTFNICWTERNLHPTPTIHCVHQIPDAQSFHFHCLDDNPERFYRFYRRSAKKSVLTLCEFSGQAVVVLPV